MIRRADRGFQHVALPVTAVTDNRLSFRARGVLLYILAQQDGWSTNSEKLASDTKEGRDAIRTAINELIDYGYMIRTRTQNEFGKWVTITDVYDYPTTGIPSSAEDNEDELPTPENPSPILKTTNNSTTSRNNSSYSVRSIARRKAASIEDELDPEKAVWGNEGGADAPEPRPKAGRKNLRTRAISAGGNLARDFAARARKARPGMPGETNQGALSGQFNRWMKQDDLDASVIRGMFDTYFSDERLWDSNRPMWVDFLNKRARLATAGQREADLREAQDNRLNPDYWTEVEQVEHDASYWESV